MFRSMYTIVLFLVMILYLVDSRPEYKDIDYRFYDEKNEGVAIDAVFEVLDHEVPDHHRHGHRQKHKKVE